jgi:hypothetical protein
MTRATRQITVCFALLLGTLTLLVSTAHAAVLPNPFTLATQRAEAFWQAAPPCGHPHLSLTASVPAGDDGMAIYQTCTAEIQASSWPNERAAAVDWAEVCRVATHEIGHLILGPAYYAASNPTNPAHSPDERNVMFYDAATWGAYPSSCFPATFKLGNGTIVKWTGHGRKVLGVSRTRHGHEWNVIEGVEGCHVELASEARAR